MSIFSKKIDEITKEDLEELITEGERESINLDYKQGINPTIDGKHDLIRHVVGMSNTEGGYIIYGIEENKEQGIPTRLIGIDSSIGKQKVDEWIENIITPHVSPRAMIRIKTISLEGKIAVIMWIPKSSRRPHMSTYENDFRIYRRYNTQTLPASESEIREMYFSSNKYEKKLEEFLTMRNLNDVYSDDFVLNFNSRKLFALGEPKPKDPPFVLFASCPRFLEERADIVSNNLQSFITKNFQTTIQKQEIRVFNPHDLKINSNSVVFEHPRRRDELLEYFEFHRNGYVEEGLCLRVIKHYQHHTLLLHLGKLTVAFWSFLQFLKKYYEKIDYYDPFSVYLCIRNTNQLGLTGFLGLSKNGDPWGSPHDDIYDELGTIPYSGVTSYLTAIPTTPNNRNFMYNFDLNSNTMDEKSIFETVKEFSNRVANEFGLPSAYCYNYDGSFAKIHLNAHNRWFR